MIAALFVNPMLVEGQIMGVAVQGLGGILGEAIAYDFPTASS